MARSNPAASPTPPPVVPAPAYLSPSSAELWDTLVTAGRAVSPERRELLAQGLVARDRAIQAREALDRDGLVIRATEGGIMRAHPALRAEKDALGLFSKIWGQLGLSRRGALDGFAWKDGRP